MKTTAVSTHAISTSTRLALIKQQAELADGSKELSSGRWADVGLKLGARTGHSVELRQEMARIETLIDTNGMVRARLDTSQAALANVAGVAENFLGVLIAMRENPGASKIVSPQAGVNLKGLIGTMNANLNGQYLFAGINTDLAPVADYHALPTSAAKAAIDAAFAAAFPDPSVATAADMQAFVDGTLAPMFDGGWAGTWSNASDENLRSRITTSEVMETSANANEKPFRDLMMAYVLTSQLSPGTISPDAYKVLVERSTELVGSAMQGLTMIQARLGVAQARTADASARMSLQRDILSKQITGLENVDPFETATRVNALMSQVEVSYSLTARIREMSLLRYL